MQYRHSFRRWIRRPIVLKNHILRVNSVLVASWQQTRNLQKVVIITIITRHGHPHNGDQAARRPYMMCSNCGRRLTTPLFGARGDWNELIRQPAHAFLLAPHWHIWSTSNRLVAISKGSSTPGFGVLEGRGGSGIGPFDSPTRGSC